jgi:RimJ/RimL family protein N-acetyltransferase
MLSFRKASLTDVKLYFDWANDSSVREQSYNSTAIDFENHTKWFESKLEDADCLMLVFQNEKKQNVGQIRIQKENDSQALIGVSIASEHRGKGYAKEMIQLGSDYFLDSNPDILINAFIKEQNLSSKYAFEKAGFVLEEIVNYENFKSFHYIKSTRK